jgi:ribosome-associated heat shock protein Hsp15
MAEGPDSLRLDKWLWYARFCKTRSLATTLCRAGQIRVNRQPVNKANHSVRLGDILTFAQGTRVLVVRIEALGERRGSAQEAQALYKDLSPSTLPREERPHTAGVRDAGAGRPTKRERRAIDQLRDT